MNTKIYHWLVSKEWIENNELNHLKTLRGSCSAASKPIFASRYSLLVETSWRDLQDFQTFAPLTPQNFRKDASNVFAISKIGFQNFICSDRILNGCWQRRRYVNRSLRVMPKPIEILSIGLIWTYLRPFRVIFDEQDEQEVQLCV